MKATCSLLAALTLSALAALTCSAQTLNLSVNGTTSSVTFTGIPGVNYTIQTSTNLTDPASWQNAHTFVGNDDTQYAYTSLAGQTKMFYRSVSFVSSTNLAYLGIDGSNPQPGNYQVIDPLASSLVNLTVLVFTLQATNGSVNISNIIAHVSSPLGGSGGTITVAHLFRGSTLLGSAMVNPFTPCTFSGITDTTIPAHSIVAFTIKVDVFNVTPGPGFTVTASVTGPGVSVVDASNPSKQVLVSGVAAGNIITVVPQGPVFSLQGSSVAVTDLTPIGSTQTVHRISATFNVAVTAFGETIDMGLPYKTRPAFWTNSALTQIVVNGVAVNPSAYGMTVNYDAPATSAVTILSGAEGFRIAENQTVQIPVTYSFTVTNGGANVYAIQVNAIDWATTNAAQDGDDLFETAVSVYGSWRSSSAN